MQDWFKQLTASIRVADVLDVGVFTVLLYFSLMWFRQRATRSLALGLMLAIGLYLCARWLDMYLTTMLFQAGFTVVVLALIVVFQQDVRRAFERLAASDLLGHSGGTAPKSDVIDTLVESIATMADDRTGALLVFEGREPLDQHVRGGVAVDGRISLPLLYSIFHPQSPGHDGAVVIQDARIDSLGVHLPLSWNLAKIGDGGTRHAAALGLAELSDALVVVISEERGTISVAQHGQIREIKPAELSTRLKLFYQDQSKSEQSVVWLRGVTRNFGWKLAALSLACVAWLLLAYRVETIRRTYVVPIEYRNLPETWIIGDPKPTRAELTLSGSERAFDMLDPGDLTISFNLGQVQSEMPYSFRTEVHLRGLPNELNVNQIRPENVTVTVHRKRDVRN
jgi:diadenylate cyclase